jgi:hypothetical protein
MLSQGLSAWSSLLTCFISRCRALSHRYSFVVLSDNCSLRIMRKHLFINTLQVAFVVLQVSDPYKRIIVTFVLKIFY